MFASWFAWDASAPSVVKYGLGYAVTNLGLYRQSKTGEGRPVELRGEFEDVTARESMRELACDLFFCERERDRGLGRGRVCVS